MGGASRGQHFYLVLSAEDISRVVDEWANFLERIWVPKLGYSSKDSKELVRHWVSYRGQTLARTVRGMMYYHQAIDLQCFLECAEDRAISSGYRTIDKSEARKKITNYSQALTDSKFTYVVSCQVYGNQKAASDPKDRSSANNILILMLTYPSLRVACIDEREDVNNKSGKVYYSVLVKGGDKLDEDNYYEEAFKMRNVLEEFQKSHHKGWKPTILGLREHIFTGSVSSLTWFMSNQEYIQVGKGHDVGMNQISQFEAKVANGNGEQTLSRDVY